MAGNKNTKKNRPVIILPSALIRRLRMLRADSRGRLRDVLDMARDKHNK